MFLLATFVLFLLPTYHFFHLINSLVNCFHINLCLGFAYDNLRIDNVKIELSNDIY